MNYLYPRANLDLFALNKLAHEIAELSIDDIVSFNNKSSQMPWESACTVRLYPNNSDHLNVVFRPNPEAVKDLLNILNNLTQENISFLAKISSKSRVGLAYTFTLPPPPPGGGG